MGSVPDILIVAAVAVAAPVLLTVRVTILVRRQNRRVLAQQEKSRLQAMLQAGDFLDELAKDQSVPLARRSRAEELGRHYPAGDQLRVFAEALLRDLEQPSRQPSPSCE